MTIFCVDLDNTLIYSHKRFGSYKHFGLHGYLDSDKDLDSNERFGSHGHLDSDKCFDSYKYVDTFHQALDGCKRCVERYQGREGAFMSERTWELLREVTQKALVVPVTTRTVEQYQRVDLGIGEIPYALVCNGGIMLANGMSDDAWYQESLKMVWDGRQELESAGRILERDENRCFEVREIQGLFLFTKSERAEESAARLRAELDGSLVEVFHSRNKVYVMPKKLTKGSAVLRLKEKLKAGRVIAAGDSELDIPMLRCADVGIAPAGLEVGESTGAQVKIGEGKLFSEGMLEYILYNVL